MTDKTRKTRQTFTADQRLEFARLMKDAGIIAKVPKKPHYYSTPVQKRQNLLKLA